MTRNEWERAAWSGWRLGNAGFSAADFGAVMRLGTLNRRATAAWERLNRSGGKEPQCSRATKANERACDEAREIAEQRGWTLDMSGGLWWFLNAPGYDRVDCGNMLAGIH